MFILFLDLRNLTSDIIRFTYCLMSSPQFLVFEGSPVSLLFGKSGTHYFSLLDQVVGLLPTRPPCSYYPVRVAGGRDDLPVIDDSYWPRFNNCTGGWRVPLLLFLDPTNLGMFRPCVYEIQKASRSTFLFWAFVGEPEKWRPVVLTLSWYNTTGVL